MSSFRYEADQVVVTTDASGKILEEKDRSLPINRAYNHHYVAYLYGKNADMAEITLTGPDDPRYMRLSHDSYPHKGLKAWHIRSKLAAGSESSV